MMLLAKIKGTEIELGFYKLKEKNKVLSRIWSYDCYKKKDKATLLEFHLFEPAHWGLLSILRYTTFLHRPRLTTKTKHRLLELTLQDLHTRKKKKRNKPATASIRTKI